MKFKEFILNEDPMGMGAPMGGDPMGGGMGGDPMGGGMGGDPMMGGGMGGAPPMDQEPPMMGGAPPMDQEPPMIPQHADIWEVLDSILNDKPFEHKDKLAKQKERQAQQPDMGQPPSDPMQQGMEMDPMQQGMGDPAQQPPNLMS